ncbi:hypothetical protein PVK06_045536 [Gossypium arboreum]|uniref:Uncharacterized protein n=1 Tax=Gossypium arboreum TaxID=29729 RepID=A0ABR0MUC0_GOSAR|nr:hypothetical protein PVK06_045536 [Gossypium arboreum]
MNGECPFCLNIMEDANNVMRICSAVVVTWALVVITQNMNEFLSMEIKDWVFVNLRFPDYFANDAVDWDVLFEAICRNLWQRCNRLIFDEDFCDMESVVQRRSQRLNLEVIRSRGSEGLELDGGNQCDHRPNGGQDRLKSGGK